MEIDDTDGNDGHIYRLRKIDDIQEILIAERDKRKELRTKYSRGVNIFDNCLFVTAIGLGITEVSLLITIVAAQAVITMKLVSIVMGLLRVVGNRAVKKVSLKI